MIKTLWRATKADGNGGFFRDSVCEERFENEEAAREHSKSVCGNWATDPVAEHYAVIEGKYYLLREKDPVEVSLANANIERRGTRTF